MFWYFLFFAALAVWVGTTLALFPLFYHLNQSRVRRRKRRKELQLSRKHA